MIIDHKACAFSCAAGLVFFFFGFATVALIEKFQNLHLLTQYSRNHKFNEFDM